MYLYWVKTYAHGLEPYRKPRSVLARQASHMSNIAVLRTPRVKLRATHAHTPVLTRIWAEWCPVCMSGLAKGSIAGTDKLWY
jgi:hypothetical protein